MKIRPPFKPHGCKKHLDFILDYLPKNYKEYNYIEPFSGGGSVLLNKETPNTDKIEVLNDLDLGSVQIFRALRDEGKVFVTKLKKIEYCEASFGKAKAKKEFSDYMEHAINEFILRRMSRGEAKETFVLRDGEWQTTLDALPSISNRLENVCLLHKRAIEVIDAFDTSDTIIYADPPEIEDTKAKKAYAMSIDNHIEMANLLLRSKCKVILSGYSCALYNRLFKGWRKVSKSSTPQQKEKKIKVETCWLNY